MYSDLLGEILCSLSAVTLRSTRRRRAGDPRRARARYVDVRRRRNRHSHPRAPGEGHSLLRVVCDALS